MPVSDVTDDTFQAEVLEADGPVLVDFWAPWCGPCRAASPALEEIASERDGVKVVKVNVDDNQQIAADQGVLSLPTFMLFEHGQATKKVIGFSAKRKLEKDLFPG